MNLKYGSFGLTAPQKCTKKCFTAVNYKNPYAKNNIFATVIKSLDSEGLEISSSQVFNTPLKSTTILFIDFQISQKNNFEIIKVSRSGRSQILTSVLRLLLGPRSALWKELKRPEDKSLYYILYSYIKIHLALNLYV